MRELFREFVVAKRRDEHAHNDRMAMAWTVAALSRVPKNKRLPSLESLRAKRVVKQTAVQQKAVLMQIAQAYRLPVRPVSRES